MRELFSGRVRRDHPYAWLWEPLEALPGFVLRPMFGGRAAYVGGRMVLHFTAKEEPWRGVLACTDRERQAALIALIPALAPHPILPKWLYLPEADPGFEAAAARLVAMAAAAHPLLGIDPKPRRVSAASGKASRRSRPSPRPAATPPSPATRSPARRARRPR